VGTSNPTRDYLFDLGQDGRILFESVLKEYVFGCALYPPGSVAGSCEHSSKLWDSYKAWNFCTSSTNVTDSERIGWSRRKIQGCIWEVFGSNLGRNMDYPEWDFLLFSSVLTWKCWDSTSYRPQQLPSKSFPSHSTTIPPSDAMHVSTLKATHGKRKTLRRGIGQLYTAPSLLSAELYVGSHWGNTDNLVSDTSGQLLSLKVTRTLCI
jgi:hypothetical protein